MNSSTPWIPASGWERSLEIVTLAVLLASWVIPIMHFGDLPDEIPIHFNARGEADGWGTKWTLFLLPAISVFIYLLISYLARIGPDSPYASYPVKITEENKAIQHQLQREQTRIIKFFTLLLLLHITWGIVQLVQEDGSRLPNWPVFLYLIIIFGTIFYYYRKARQRA